MKNLGCSVRSEPAADASGDPDPPWSCRLDEPVVPRLGHQLRHRATVSTLPTEKVP